MSRSPDEPSGGASACNGSKVTATDRDNASMGSQEPRRIRPYPVSLDTGSRESLDLMSVLGPGNRVKGSKARALPWTRQGRSPWNQSAGICGSLSSLHPRSAAALKE